MFGLALGAANSQPINAQGWLANSHRYALPVLSAYANAEQKGADTDKLFVKEAVIGEGPTMKRFRPKARGSAGPIRKRRCHVRIILSDE